MNTINLNDVWSQSHSNNISIFGVTINRNTPAGASSWIVQQALFDQNTKRTCNFVNADCLNNAYKNQRYRQVLSQSNRVYADGSGIRLACKIKKVPSPNNINGTDLFPDICEHAGRHFPKQFNVFFLGGAKGVAEKMLANMQERYPDVNFVGCQHGYFDKEKPMEVINKINQSKANLLLVGMGAPYQELWISKHRKLIETPMCMGVGGLFDYYSGNIKRAPLWMRKVGCEWVWRFLQEPGRLAKRYLIGNILFVLRVQREQQEQRSLKKVTLNPFFCKQEETGCVGIFTKKLTSLSQSIRNLVTKLSKQENKLQPALKRIVDISAASIGLIVLLPLFLITAVLIRIESKGAIFFSQTRIGKNGCPFKLWKFRSMYVNAEQIKAELEANNEMSGGVLFKIKRDPRVTRIGYFIRKYSIDELPQLWNVLNGSMSLVGPRPALYDEVAQYSKNDRQRLLVKPGITCIWQVSGRSHIPFEQQVELDQLYISQRSLWTDLKLLIVTIPAVLSSRGAY